MMPWTLGQRRALIAVVVGIALLCASRFAFTPAFISDPQPANPIHSADLADRLDPNVADVATLSALPQIGPGRAKAIVAYREQARARNPNRPAFTAPSDLMLVKGIGLSIANQLEPYLIFPSNEQ